FATNNISFYTLSIPALKIENASVAIGGEDLAEYLIQYPGTAMPGKRGNAVVFGHSVLPQFFDPKSYITIFSKLDKLKSGDEIFVSYDGVAYKYRVENMTEVVPTDSQVLEQNLSDAFITLVTCTPPGDPTRPKRLIVKGRIVPPGEANANIRN
ncbi:MAG: sortase, partial [Patescibacteria group bacterium]